MSVLLDLKRMAELGGLIGSDLAGLLSSLVDSMADGIDALGQALADADLPRATQAAHSCRNDALIVGAGQVQEALSEVESRCREEALAPAREAFGRVQLAWPATRVELERAARLAHPG
jgi:HPt (histidine-containing phosphotransfer) domain-containing protein